MRSLQVRLTDDGGKLVDAVAGRRLTFGIRVENLLGLAYRAEVAAC